MAYVPLSCDDYMIDNLNSMHFLDAGSELGLSQDVPRKSFCLVKSIYIVKLSLCSISGQ